MALGLDLSAIADEARRRWPGRDIRVEGLIPDRGQPTHVYVWSRDPAANPLDRSPMGAGRDGDEALAALAVQIERPTCPVCGRPLDECGRAAA